MAKNRVAPDRPSKLKNSFFHKSQSNFKSRTKTGQNKKNVNISHFQNETQHAPEERYFKPSLSGSDNFFISNNNNTVREVSEPRTVNIGVSKLKSNKKPFDKKKYRLQKYSKKYKLQQWEDKRKKAVLRGYYHGLKEDGPKLDVKEIYEKYKDEIDSEDENLDNKIQEENENNLNASISQNTENTNTVEEIITSKNSKGKKNKAFKKAHLEFQRIKEEKQKANEDKLKKKAEREEALKEYKRKKVEKFKKFSRRTKQGQPIMKDRIEMLLEKIQNTM